MKVGALQETVTVTGEAPLVDVQSSVTQQIINRDLLDVLVSGGILSLTVISFEFGKSLAILLA